MNTVTLIAILLLALVLLVFAVLLPVAIVFNVRAGEKYRRGLAEQVNRLRLGRMLGALGIDIGVYLNTERSRDIERHIDRCAACEHTVVCDDRLAEGSVDPASIDFCNNEASLRDIAGK